MVKILVLVSKCVKNVWTFWFFRYKFVKISQKFGFWGFQIKIFHLFGQNFGFNLRNVWKFWFFRYKFVKVSQKFWFWGFQIKIFHLFGQNFGFNLRNVSKMCENSDFSLINLSEVLILGFSGQKFSFFGSKFWNVSNDLMTN